MRQTDNSIDIGSIENLRAQFYDYLGLPKHRLLTKTHIPRFARFLKERRPEIPVQYAVTLWQLMKQVPRH